MASRRADELQSRMQKRLAELELEKRISATPPVIAGGALVIPCGLLNKLMGRPASFTEDAAARRRIELAAMNAVMEIETELRFLPRDVSRENVGYDIESRIPEELRGPDGDALRFIEVKGRCKGADTVTVTKNEILTALNEPEKYILAVVELDSDRNRVVYLKHLAFTQPAFASVHETFDISKLISESEIVLER